MDRPRFVAEMVHGLALRHARRTRPLRPGVTIGVQAASFYPQHPATPAKLAGARIRVPCVHTWEEITVFRQLLEQSREAQLRFDYAEALIYNKAVVKHAPQFAEGWNQLGYVYFLAGQYDASLDAIEHVLALEPMHYAALAGKGIILYYAGKVEEAQAPLKRALAINPWLKERNLIGKDSLPTP